MTQVPVLDADDIRLLKEMTRAYKTNRQNSSSRTHPDTDDPTASDVYIAYPQEATGIPALQDAVGTGTGTGPEEGDLPGSALCDIYRIIGETEIIPVGFDIRVFNLSSNDIDQDWLTVAKDKFGTWLVTGTGGASVTPYIITQRDEFGTGTGTSGGETGLKAAIYQGAYPEFYCRKATWNGSTWAEDLAFDEVLVKCDFQNGVMFTGDYLLVHKINGQLVAKGGHTLGHFFDDCTYLSSTETIIKLDAFGTDNPVVPATVRFGEAPSANTTVSIIFDSYHQRFTVLQAACP